MKVIGKITLFESLTQSKIDDLIASEGVVAIQVERNYSIDEIPGVISLIVPSGVGVGFLDAFKEVTDEASWLHEENAYVFVAIWKESNKVIDLSASYVRSQKDTSVVAPMEGKGYNLVLSVPGFDGNKTAVCELVWGLPIAPGEIAKAKLIGIDIAGSGASIEFLNLPCNGFRATFSKASGEVGNYVFDNDFKEKVLGV